MEVREEANAAEKIVESECSSELESMRIELTISFCRQKSNLKRQRTGSTSPHSHGTSNIYPHDGESDMEAATRKNRNNGRKAKASVPPEQGEREIREREKSEAAGRRKGRAERRRVEGVLYVTYFKMSANLFPWQTMLSLRVLPLRTM